MQEENLTLKVSTHDIASCNTCYARNYDSTHGDAIGERVDKLYELKIDDQVLTLCDKCLDRLREKLGPAAACVKTVIKAGYKIEG